MIFDLELEHDEEQILHTMEGQGSMIPDKRWSLDQQPKRRPNFLKLDFSISNDEFYNFNKENEGHMSMVYFKKKGKRKEERNDYYQLCKMKEEGGLEKRGDKNSKGNNKKVEMKCRNWEKQ